MAYEAIRYGWFPARDWARGPAARVDFMRLVGRRAWGGLAPAVRTRFAHHPPGLTVGYDGSMTVRATPLGSLFAHACRLIGTPLAPWTGEAVPVRVEVWTHPKGGLVWDRIYAFKGRAPVRVSSRKIMDRRGELMEVVRGGLGMMLRVTVEDGALHFRSSGYFLALGRLRLPIPAPLTPGAAHVVHRDEGDGRFRFTMRFVHPLAGETLFQDGVFEDPKEIAP